MAVETVHGGFAILDFGSQLTQVIARRFRELGYYSELFPYDVDIEKIKKMNPAGIILSGGPSSVNNEDSPHRTVKELAEIAPLLGICYGMQLIAKELGGVIEKAETKEYGDNEISWKRDLYGVPLKQKVWMSHGDILKAPPPGFSVTAYSEFNHPAAMEGPGVMAMQFHPEVSHTQHGEKLFQHFAQKYCKAKKTWNSGFIAEHLLESVRQKVGVEDHVLCAISGGVDSTVVGTLLTKALGAQRVHCVFVNNGLLRKNEYESVLNLYQKVGLNVQGVDASELFVEKLSGVSDPEKKRKIIGGLFIDVFMEATKNLPNQVKWLAQGTLYPDVIESVSLRGESATIKSHHNVGGLPDKMDLDLVEPLRELFKDEVRHLGKQLGLSRDVLWRHPFPGPGLAIRIMGEVTKESLDVLRDCDDIYIRELKDKNLYDKIWQAFCVLLPVKTVGVQGDARTYEKVLVIRAVTSQDGMTADWHPFSPDFMKNLSNRITNEVSGVNRVVYDVTSKPPGTIEWE